MAKKIPKWLQPTLWSVKVDHLDLEEDKVYIINQVLAFGGTKEWRWLFRNYPLKTVKEVFLHQPLRIYNSMNFNFVKEILLEISDINLDFKKYVRWIYRRPGEDWWKKRWFFEKVDPTVYYQEID